MAMTEYVSVIVDGTALTGFQEVTRRWSMQDAAIAFTLVATWPENSTQAKALVNADEIEIRTTLGVDGHPPPSGGGDLLCLGAVDSYEADIGEGAHKTITLHGRSHARDIVDCPPVNHATLRSENKTLLEVMQDIGAEFGVGWSTDQALSIIDKVQAIPGEPLFWTGEREARMEGLMLAGQPDGTVLITRAGTKRHVGALVLGQPPVQRVSVKLNPGKQRSQVVVQGQRATGTGADLQQETRYQAPNATGRHRPAKVLLEGERRQNKLVTRGAWHHLRSFGFGTVVSPTVSGWRDAGGVLWHPGWLCAVTVASEGIDMDMTLSEATIKQRLGANGGTTADLVFVDPRAHGGTAPMGSEDQGFNPGDSIEEP